jgi:uncharacterized protein YecE (DUF72 family)
MGRFLIGTSGWNYPHWRGRFYPRGLPADEWLTYYAGQFPTVEVNYTFYRLPERRTFVAWHAAAPRRFIFALKASRFITHVRRLRDARGPVGRLLTRARPLAQALGPILFQLAPTFACDEERLAAFLARLPSGRRYAVEFRHESWHREPVYRLLRRHGVVRVRAVPPLRHAGRLLHRSSTSPLGGRAQGRERAGCGLRLLQ